MGSRTRTVLASVFGMVGLGGYLVLAAEFGPGFAIPMGIMGLLAGTAAVVMLGPVGKAIARRIHKDLPEGEALEDVLVEMDSMRGRIAELEERLDFAERLLARVRDPAALPRAHE